MRAQQGFTLIEMLVVMAILAILAAFIIPSLSLPTRPPKPPMAAYFEEQQKNAIETGQPRRVFVDKNTLSSEPQGAEFPLGKGQSLIIERPMKTKYLPKQLVAVFYPDSTAIISSFWVVQEVRPGQTQNLYHIDINPFDGAVKFTYP
jgi:prepilin-type N-terminal cleavage/methylation domain-containing protein